MEWGRQAEALLRGIERDAREGDPARLGELRSFLFGLSSKDLLSLDGYARWTPYGYRNLGAPPDPWADVVLAEPTGVSATVASWQRDGYLRERATRELARLGSPLAARALALRTVDPVQQVRIAAMRGIASQLHERLLPEVIDVIVAANRRFGGAAALTWFEQWLRTSGRTEAVITNALGSRRRGARRWALARGIEKQSFTREQLLKIALADPDQWVPPVAAAAVLRVEPVLAASLTRSSSVVVRRLAIHALRDEDLAPEDWDELLSDRSTRVRVLARERASRLGIDVMGRDAVALRDEARTRDVVAALSAVTARTPRSVRDLVANFVDHPVPRVRAACALAIVHALPVHESVLALASLLGDVNYRVARTSAVGLAKLGADASIGDTWWDRGSSSSRRAVWLFWSRLGGWDALTGHLRALASGDDELRERGERAMKSWARDVLPRMWMAPSAAQRSLILDHLPEARVSAKLRREIEFAMRTSPA